MRILILNARNHYGDTAYWHRCRRLPSTAAAPDPISISGSPCRPAFLLSALWALFIHTFPGSLWTLPLALVQQIVTVAGTAMTSISESLRITLYIDEPAIPQFVERSLHAGTGTVAERRHSSDIYRTGILAAATGSQIAVHRELYRCQTVAEQRGVHLDW